MENYRHGSPHQLLLQQRHLDTVESTYIVIGMIRWSRDAVIDVYITASDPGPVTASMRATDKAKRS